MKRSEKSIVSRSHNPPIIVIFLFSFPLLNSIPHFLPLHIIMMD